MTALQRLTRALSPSQTRSRQLGGPPTYTDHHYRHAQRQLRRAELVRARALVPRMLAYGAIAGAAMAIVTTIAFGLAVAAALAASLIALAVFPCDQHRQPWQEWRHTRRYLTARLQRLGPQWTVLWDRRLHAAPTPVTIALGHSGVWLLWAPEPEWATHHPSHILQQLVQEIADTLPHSSLTVHVATAHTAADIDRAVKLMIAGAHQAGADELREWAQHLHLATIQEPLLIPQPH
jgi:hypothetical protein